MKEYWADETRISTWSMLHFVMRGKSVATEIRLVSGSAPDSFRRRVVGQSLEVIKE